MTKKLFFISLVFMPMMALAQSAQECYNKGYEYESKKDYTNAEKWYRKAANQGHASAQYSLGLFYRLGYGVTRNVQESEKWWKTSAMQGNAKAQFALGLSYDNGDGVNVDKKEAEKWYLKSAEQGLSDAQLNIGLLYLLGDGVPKDEKEALMWLLKASGQGNLNATQCIGSIYEKGTGVTPDFVKAKEYYQKAAEAGYINSMLSLGKLYETGKGVPQNYSKAEEWYKKALNKNPNSKYAKEYLENVQKLQSNNSLAQNNQTQTTSSGGYVLTPKEEAELDRDIMMHHTSAIKEVAEKGNKKAIDALKKAYQNSLAEDAKLYLLKHTEMFGYNQYDEDVKTIQQIYQEVVDFTKAGKEEKFIKDVTSLYYKSPHYCATFYSKYPEYDKQGIAKKAQLLDDFCKVNSSLYSITEHPYGWHIERRFFGLEEVPVWKQEANDYWFKDIDDAIAICNKYSTSTTFNSVFKKSLPKLKTKRANGEANLKEQRAEYEAALSGKNVQQTRLDECRAIEKGEKPYPAAKKTIKNKDNNYIEFADGTTGTLFYDKQDGWYVDPGVIGLNRYYKTYAQAEKALYLYKKYKYESEDGKK